MKKTSTIHYTFEDVSGSAETFRKRDFERIVEKEEVTGKVLVELVGENESIEVPMLKGYKEPYDSDVTDEIGTEHHIYYEEIEPKTQEDWYQIINEEVDSRAKFIELLVSNFNNKELEGNHKLAIEEYAVNNQGWWNENP